MAGSDWGGADAVRERIAEKGWALVHEARPGRPPLTYTSGLFETHGHPELAVTGLPQSAGAALLGACARRVELGESMESREGVAGLLEGYHARFGCVDQNEVVAHMGLVGVGAESAKNVPVVRVWWPDRNGAFPWEEACEAASKALQPERIGEPWPSR